MAGYTRQSVAEIQTGQIVLALPINNEFNALQAAFHASTGHTHDGTTGNGPLINLTNSVAGVLPVNRGGFAGIHKVNGTAGPTVNDDSGDNYAVGSHWIDTTNDVIYTAVDVTPGAAVWLAQQDYDDTLTAWAAYNSNGIVVQTSQGNWAARTITAPAAGITVSNGNGVSGNPTLALANDLAAVEGLSSNGIAVRTADGTWTVRSVASSGEGLSVSNGDGVSNNPTIALADDMAAIEALASTGIAVRTGASTWAQRTITTSGAGISITNGSGAGGDPQLSIADDLAAVEALSSNGLATRTASNTWTVRTITGTANEITVTNGDGVSGAPTLSLPSALTFTGKTITGGSFTGGTLNNAVIGGSTPAAGTFTTVNGTTITASTGFVGPIDGIVGGTTPAAGTFTDFTASGNFRLTNTTDLSVSSTGHAFQIGDSSGQNLALDNNEIWSRNNGSSGNIIFNGGNGEDGMTLSSTGNLTVKGTVQGTSDAALKENDEEIHSVLDRITKIKGRTYNRIGQTEIEAGTFAQEWEDLPGVVGKTEKGLLTVNPTAQIAYLLEAIKELKEKIDDLS